MFSVIAKPTGPACNLRCRYCFYLEKEALYPDTSSWAMRDEVLESFIRQYIESQPGPVVAFSWQGGEPTLLGLDFFRRVVELQDRHADGKRIENAFQTNGVLLDDDWAAFLAERSFLVGLSIDGPRALHDRYRVNRGGQPTFDHVMRGRDALLRHGVAFNTLTAVHRRNASEPLEVYRFLRAEGSGYLQFIPIVDRLDGERVASWSVDPLQFGDFLCTIFDEWVRHDVGTVFVQQFDVALESWFSGEASLCAFQRTCGSALAIEHNGDLYSCDHYVNPGSRLGNILEQPLAALAASGSQLAFGRAKEDTLASCCRECDVLFACRGECPRNRFVSRRDGVAGQRRPAQAPTPAPPVTGLVNYLCPGYKRFFRYVDPYMRFMAEQLRHEQPPAAVMAWTAAHERGARPRTAGRNDPCPCGSGHKYKKCCGAAGR